VRNSTLVAPTNGLHVTAGSEASVRGNVITSARPGLAGGGGIFIEGGTVRFVRNDVSRFNLGVFAFSGQALVFGNTIHDGRVGVSLGFGMTGATAIDNDIRRGVEGFVVGSVGALVSGNRIDVDGGLAFDVQDPASRNQFVANVATDGECSDSTRGAGTAGTANTWIDNIGAPSFPPKICRPPSP
jgi:nitrous oxidase accessory protein NosD